MSGYALLQSDPGEQGDAEHEIEQSLVGDRQDDKCRREGEEDHN